MKGLNRLSTADTARPGNSVGSDWEGRGSGTDVCFFESGTVPEPIAA